MSDNKLYTQSTLTAQQQNLLNRETALNTAGEDIKAELTALEGVWTGNASSEFLNAANLWITGFNEVMGAFSMLNTSVGMANESFAQAETSRANLSQGSWT